MNGFYNSVQDWIDAGMPLNSFICGDCMEGMAAMPDKFFDLAIVDPPYGIDRLESGGMPKSSRFKQWDRKKWDREKPIAKYWHGLFKVSGNQIVWGGNYFSDFLKPSMGWIFWFKQKGMTFADGELAWTSFEKAIRQFNHPMGGEIDKIHPTQKPKKLYEWLLQNYAKPIDIILDTHVGSASSLITCEKMGFRYIGFEIDRDYFDAACNRILQARELLKQEDMFKVQDTNGKATIETLKLF